MRKLILALIVVVGGLSVVQDADAFWWRRSYSRYQRSRPSRIYYDSGIAFEYDSKRSQVRTRPSRVYYDSGMAFEYDSKWSQVRTRPSRVYYDSGMALEYYVIVPALRRQRIFIV